MSPPQFKPIPFESSFVSEQYVKKAERELNESPEARVQGIKELRELIAADKSLTDWREEEDSVLLMFLRARKFNVQRAFSSFKSYVHIQRKNKPMCTNIRVEAMIRAIETKALTFLPYRCPDGCAIICIKMDNWDPNEICIDDLKQFIPLMMLASIRDPLTQINGYKVIFDFKGNVVRHLRYCTPHNMYLIYHGCIECLPSRFKGIHIVNQQILFKVAWMLLKPFMSEKVRKRVFYHDEPETLLKYFPKEVLLEEYGGILNDFGNTEWVRKMCQPENIARLYALDS